MITPWKINDYIKDPGTGKDRWQIHRILKGGMGIVYIVYDTLWRDVFAVKTCLDKLQSIEAQEKFKIEANIWINLDYHENVAWARMVESIQNRLYLFLEYVPGGDLSCWIGTKRLDLKQVLLFALQFCYGMEHAQAKGVKAHRDIKPQNCLITENGTLKITDFGLAKTLDTADFGQTLVQYGNGNITATHTGQIGGTLPYMAPEQFEDLKQVDSRADIYSFGILLFEMLTGKVPFWGNTFSDFKKKHQRDSVPDFTSSLQLNVKPLMDIILKCLSKLPENRYQDFSHLRHEIIQFFKHIFSYNPPYPTQGLSLDIGGLNNKGCSLENLGKYEDAILCYDKAIKLEPDFSEAWSNKGNALTSLGRFEEAIASHNKAIEIEPEHAICWHNKGNTYRKAGMFSQALENYNQAHHLKPDFIPTFVDKSDIFVNLKNYFKAIECCDRAIELNPNESVAWMNKGIALKNLARYREAIKCYDKALDINPDSKKVWSNKGVVLTIMGNYEESLLCFNRALDLDPGYAKAWSNKCTALLRLNRNVEALYCSERALEFDPNNAMALNNKAAVLCALGRLNEALPYAQKAQELGEPLAAKILAYIRMFIH